MIPHPTPLEIEVAAARLVAGYHAANDTADDLADPYVREAIDFMLERERIIADDGTEFWLAIQDDAGWLGDLVSLYLEQAHD